MAASVVFFIMGICDFVWGFWAGFVDRDPNPSPSIASRFESGVIFCVISFVIYQVVKRKRLRQGVPSTKITVSEERTSLTPASVAKGVAERITETFSSDRFISLFGDKKLIDGWSMGQALAVWYSLGNLALVVIVWQMFDNNETRFRVIDLCRSKLLERWNMPTEISDQLVSVVNETEGAAFKSFTTCKDGSELGMFFSRYISRILGAPIPFSNVTIIEDILVGHEYADLDPILEATISRMFIATISIKRFIKDNPTVW